MITDTLQNLANTIGSFLQTDQDSIDWETKPSPAKWSKKEIIGHLIDSAQINLQRFIRCTYEENFKLIYEQNEWVAAAHYQDADIKELLDLWILLNRQIMRVLSDYPADRLGAVCDNDKNATQLHTVEWLAADYVRHMQHHLGQVH
jgi:DinB superfamily